MEKLKLGLCCLWVGDDSLKFKTLTVKRFNELGRKEGTRVLSERILHNFKTTYAILKKCKENNYASYRLSSNLWACLLAPSLSLSISDLPDYGAIEAQAALCGRFAKLNGIRVSFHPSEFISLTSDSDQVVDNSIADLDMHGFVLDLMGLPQSHFCPINIHIRKDGDRESLSAKFMRSFDRLCDSTKKRLVLENNDNPNGCWGIKSLTEFFFNRHGIPITYDHLHHKLLDEKLSPQDAFNLSFSTWHDIVPLFHFSCGINGTRKHTDYATERVPNYGDVYWDCELKAKNLAIDKIKNDSRN